MIAKSLIVLIPLIGLTGCSAKYGCKGMPDDPTCLSAVEAYRATDKTSANSASAGQANASETSPVTSGTSLAPPVVTSLAPKIDDPTPIRTPSQVMRIWIAPWEDAEGDLNVSGYVFTELEPRRWMIGKPVAALNSSISPLQVLHRERPEARKSGVLAEKERETPMPPLYGSPESPDP